MDNKDCVKNMDEISFCEECGRSIPKPKGFKELEHLN